MITGIGQHSPSASGFNIRIVRLISEKTRALTGSETAYQVYFELSQTPEPGWRTAFEQEWKMLNAGRTPSLQLATIEKRFLVIHCPLEEVVGHVPLLAQAVAASNTAYRTHVEKLASERQ